MFHNFVFTIKLFLILSYLVIFFILVFYFEFFSETTKVLIVTCIATMQIFIISFTSRKKPNISINSDELEQLKTEQKRLKQQLDDISKKTNQFEKKYAISNNSITQPRSFRDLNDSSFDEVINKFNDCSTNQLELNIKQQKNNFNIRSGDTANTELNWDILLLALNFPTDTADHGGFDAMRIASQNKQVADLLRASEDFLNLIAQNGIYLDDLYCEYLSVKAWRNLSSDEKSLFVKRTHYFGIDENIEILKKRMRSDTIFRDSALILIRRFDQLLKEKLHLATDQQVFKISKTRTGKAFLIIGQISEAF